MPALAAIVAAAILWAWWSGRLQGRQILPLLLMIAGAGLAARGQFPVGIGAIAVGAAWFGGVRRRVSKQQSRQYEIDKARHLLGASARDDADMIRKRHRRLMAENHPDHGGSDERAQALNEARDLLLAELRGNTP